MNAEIDILIDESLDLRKRIQNLQEEYDGKRKRIFDIMSSSNQKSYIHGQCKAVRTEAVSIESLSKELFIKALQEVDIEREKKVFIWNKSIKEVNRPATVTLRLIPGASSGDGKQG